ncbi:hypothetical protein OSTOST_07874 [Ostertagia ostertagi]
MEQEDDEPSEDEEFLREAKKIIDDFGRGVEVSHLVRHLKRPAHSYDVDATSGIYEVLEMISSLDKTTRSSSGSPPHTSSPLPTNEYPNYDISQLNGSAKRRLSFSPTMQVAECGSEEVRETPFIPKLQLDLSAPSSIEHSPQVSPGLPAAVEYRTRVRPRCHQCHSRTGSLNAADFLYLIIFGCIASLIVYYLYMPPLHKGPVYC